MTAFLTGEDLRGRLNTHSQRDREDRNILDQCLHTEEILRMIASTNCADGGHNDVTRRCLQAAAATATERRLQLKAWRVEVDEYSNILHNSDQFKTSVSYAVVCTAFEDFGNNIDQLGNAIDALLSPGADLMGFPHRVEQMNNILDEAALEMIAAQRNLDSMIDSLRDYDEDHERPSSAAQIAGLDTSPHPLLVNAGSNLVTEIIKVCRQEKEKRHFVEVEATLAPRLGYNLVTYAKVKWLGLQDNIQDLEPSVSSLINADEGALRLTGCINLSVIFSKARNVHKVWFETFLVVEQLWPDVEFTLGGTMCDNAKIAVGDRARPIRIKKPSKETEQEEENYREALKRAKAEMEAEACQLLSESDKSPEGAPGNSVRIFNPSISPL